ncbi:Fungal transcriptional regulatory protein, partial [Metarhizium majus ARSEF 297]
MGRQWRQRPIACQSCRRRKIRCSRQFPCSNCTSRGLQCVQFYEPLEPAPEAKGKDEPKSANVSNADIRARLDKLETWITGLSDPRPGSTPSAEKIDDAHPPSPSSRSRSRHAQPLSPPSSSTVQHLFEDALWFGGHFLCCKTAKCIPPQTSFLDGCAAYQLSPIRLIKKPYSIIQDVASAFGSLAAGGREICLTLPLYHEACIILHAFKEECSILCPLFHIPSALLSMQSIYTSVQQRTPVDKSDLLLFLSIIASVTYASSPEGDVCKLFASHLEANTQCASWLAASYALSDEIKRRGQGSIVCLQGQNILCKVSAFVEGSSVRTRSLISTSIAMARDLGFHRIDHPGNKPGSLGTESEMDMEIRRQLWWDLVALDWLLAIFPGPHEGVYTIHPQHMAVNKPRIIGDGKDGTPSLQEREQQSDISYFLERIRLTEISRQYIDRCPLSESETDADYQKLLQHDARLEQYQRELPPFFSINRLSTPPTHEKPALVVHRIQVNCMVYILRCFLHLKYLSLSTINPKYAPSRTACLSSASEIVRLHRDVKSRYSWIIPRLKVTNYLRSLIMASAVFLLDVCSGTEIRDFKRERSDMLDAWRLMNDLQEDSNVVELFFEFASQMLTKYGVSEAIVADLVAQRPRSRETARHVLEQTEHLEQAYQDVGDKQMGVEMVGMGQRWQTLDADFDLKTMSWDNVLWGFDGILM